MADSFLVLVPHKTLHGTISILIQRPELATNVGKTGAVKNKLPFRTLRRATGTNSMEVGYNGWESLHEADSNT